EGAATAAALDDPAVPVSVPAKSAQHGTQRRVVAVGHADDVRQAAVEHVVFRVPVELLRPGVETPDAEAGIRRHYGVGRRGGEPEGQMLDPAGIPVDGAENEPGRVPALPPAGPGAPLRDHQLAVEPD